MSSVSQSLDSLLQSASPYSVSASLLDGKLSDAVYSGDMSGDIWKEPNQMGKNQFLFLLTTQLKYQDPLSPMENTEFVSQLAQFRALETGESTVSALEMLQSAFSDNLAAQMFASQSISNSSAMSLIGKDVRMLQPTVEWNGKDKVPINVHLGSKDRVVLNILNEDDEIVKSIDVTGKDAQNSVSLFWDGKDERGMQMTAGKYKLKVEGAESDSSLYTFVQDVVEGVRFTGEGVMVKIGGREISINEVLDVSIAGTGAISQSSALALMGKNVKARHETIQFRKLSGEVHSIMVNAQAEQAVTVEIRDNSDKVVATFRGTGDETGKAYLFWDGTTNDGEIAAAGTYKIHVVGSEKNPGLYAYTEGVVDGLTSLSGDFKLKVNGVEVSLDQILDISTPKSSI